MEEKSKDFSDVIAPLWLVFQTLYWMGLIQTLVTLSQDRRKLLATVNEKHPEVLKIDVQMEKNSGCTIWKRAELISNTEKKKRTIQAEIKVYDAELRLCQSPNQNTRESSENLSFANRYLPFARKTCGRPESLELPMCLIIPFWDYAKRGTLSSRKSNRIMVWQFYWILNSFGL